LDRFVEGIFHIHSHYSYDGRISLVQLKTGCLQRGLRFALLTEHVRGFNEDKFNHFVSECRRLSDDRVLLLPGLEFDFVEQNNLHVLMVGLKVLPEGKTADQIVASANKQGALSVVAHPVRNNHHIPDNIADIIDGIELWNAAYNSRYLPDEKAIALLRQLRKSNRRLIGLGGLDLHGPEGFRGLRIRLKGGFEDGADLLSLIRNGNFTIRGTFLALRPVPKTSSVSFCLLRLSRKLLGIADRLYLPLLRRMKQMGTTSTQKVVL
jgi:hypothetical protein